MRSPLVVGVLALQGAFAKHIAMCRALKVEAMEIRKPEELDKCDALIIPGGESTTILNQIESFKFFPKLQEFAKGHPVYGTCAGLIIMSNEVLGDKIKTLGLIDITVERNAFGKQIESFRTEIDVHLAPKEHHLMQALFIRAPRIKKSGPEVEILATFNQEPVLVQQGHFLAATFHSELTNDSTIHQYFLKMIRSSNG